MSNNGPEKKVADFNSFHLFTTLLLRHCSSTQRRSWNSMRKVGKNRRYSFLIFFLLSYSFFKIIFTALSCFPGNRLTPEASRITLRVQGNVYRLWTVRMNSIKYLTAKTFQVFQTGFTDHLSLKVILLTSFSNKKLLTNFWTLTACHQNSNCLWSLKLKTHFLAVLPVWVGAFCFWEQFEGNLIVQW